MLFDMLVELCKNGAVGMNQSFASKALEMKMSFTSFRGVDVLIARTCFAVDDIFAYLALFNKTVKLTVNGSCTERSTFLGKKGTDLLDICMLVHIVYKKAQKLFFLFCV